MNKAYKQPLKSTWIIIPAYSLVPFVYLFMEYNFATFIIMFTIYLIVSIFLFRYHSRTVAEIKNDVLTFNTGIGVKDPSELKLTSIKKTERKAKNLLAIHYNDKVMLFEAYPTVLKQLEKDVTK